MIFSLLSLATHHQCIRSLFIMTHSCHYSSGSGLQSKHWMNPSLSPLMTDAKIDWLLIKILNAQREKVWRCKVHKKMRSAHDPRDISQLLHFDWLPFDRSAQTRTRTHLYPLLSRISPLRVMIRKSFFTLFWLVSLFQCVRAPPLCTFRQSIYLSAEKWIFASFVTADWYPPLMRDYRWDASAHAWAHRCQYGHSSSAGAFIIFPLKYRWRVKLWWFFLHFKPINYAQCQTGGFVRVSFCILFWYSILRAKNTNLLIVSKEATYPTPETKSRTGEKSREKNKTSLC